MEKLIEKYKKECSIKSNLANGLWKVGNITLLIIIFLCLLARKILMTILIMVISIIFLYFLCEYINTRYIKNKIGLKGKVLIKTVYQELDKFQKDWITDYCKRNKLNNINKLKIIKQELKQRGERNSIKYVNPVIIGSLLIVVWEFVAEEVVEKIGLIYAILPLILLAVILSIIIGEINKQCKEQKQFMNVFQQYSGYERLEQLLLYRILKANK